MPVKPPHTTMLGVSAVNAIDGLLAPAGTRAEIDDAELCAAIRRGDPGSREALYHRYKRRVFALALRIVGPVDAEEVAQEAFIRIFRGLPKFRGDAALRHLDLPPGGERGAVAPDAARGRAAADAGTTTDRSTRPSRHSRRRSRRPATRSCARGSSGRWLQLPVGYRTVIVLHDVEGLEHEEIAAILGCHVGTSKSQLHKARAQAARDPGHRTASPPRSCKMGKETG